MADTSSTRRMPRLRFSLMTLLLLSTLACVTLGLHYRRTPDEIALESVRPRATCIYYCWQNPQLSPVVEALHNESPMIIEHRHMRPRDLPDRIKKNCMWQNPNATPPIPTWIESVSRRKPRVYVYALGIAANELTPEFIGHLKSFERLQYVIVFAAKDGTLEQLTDALPTVKILSLGQAIEASDSSRF